MFTTELYLSDTGNGRTFIVRRPLRYVYKLKYRVHVHHGFETDLASIPRWLTIIVPKLGRFNSAAVIHDFMYRNGYVMNFSRDPVQKQSINRKQADDIFLDAMEYSGVGYLRRKLIYFGVRSVGWRYWNECSTCN